MKLTINKNGIKKSIKNVIEKKDIEQLTPDAYRFTHNLSGFIAHYNLHGFKCEYQNVADFVRDLQNSMDIKRPNYYIEDTYFSKGDQAEYYADKSEILRYIGDLVNDIKLGETEEVISYKVKTLTY